MMSQFDAVSQQVATWAKIDPDQCRQMASLGQRVK